MNCTVRHLIKPSTRRLMVKRLTCDWCRTTRTTLRYQLAGSQEYKPCCSQCAAKPSNQARD